MSQAESRFLILLSTVPLSFFAYCISGELADSSSITWVSYYQIAVSAWTAVLIGTALFLFRSFAFRRGRARRHTIGWTGIVIAHIALFQPVFSSSDCARVLILVHGQCGLLTGIWIAACVAAWFGFEVIFSSRPPGNRLRDGRSAMTRSAVRMSFCFSMVLLLPGVYFVTWMSLAEFSGIQSEAWQLADSFFTCVFLMMVVWIAVWRKSMPRTTGKLLVLIVVSLVFAASPLAIVWSNAAYDDPSDMILGLAPIWMAGAWIIATALLWRDRGQGTVLASSNSRDTSSPVDLTLEQVNDLVCCPKCSYSLRGLSEVRCPECGWTSTIDTFVRDALMTIASD